MLPRMTAPLPALRAALTFAFLYYGAGKLMSAPSDVAIYEAIGFGQWPRFVTGSVEVVCALGLWLPGWQGRAAAALVATMAVGTFALTAFTTLPFWHLPLLGAAAATVAIAFRHQLRLPPQA